MKVKVGNTVITIRFTFMAAVLLLFCFEKDGALLPTFLFAVLHELGHCAALQFCGCGICEFDLCIFGAALKRSNDVTVSLKDEVLVALSGPAVNLFFAVVFLPFALLHTFKKAELLILVNLLLGLFNLLPFYSFDGGRAIEALIAQKKDDAAAQKAVTALSFAVAFPLTVLGLFRMLSDYHDFDLLLLSLYLLLSLIFKK